MPRPIRKHRERYKKYKTTPTGKRIRKLIALNNPCKTSIDWTTFSGLTSNQQYLSSQLQAAQNCFNHQGLANMQGQANLGGQYYSGNSGLLGYFLGGILG